MGDDDVQFGGPGGSRRRGARIAAVVAGCLVLVAIAAGLWRLQGDSNGPAADSESGSPSSPRMTQSSGVTYAGSGPVVVGHADLSWLHARVDYSLFVRTDGGVTRFEPTPDRVTHTLVPSLRSTGPVYFAAVGDRVFVRPIDFVPAYVVVDGHPARRFTTAAGQGGFLLPGPDPRHIWVSGDRGSGHGLVLVGLDGRGTPTQMRLPRAGTLPAPDGRGYTVVQAVGGVYDVRPSGTRRVGNGALLATGGGRVLVSDCDGHARCHAVLVDLDTDRRHAVPGVPTGRWSGDPGVIAPDGHTVAMVGGGITLIDLDTGTRRRAYPTVDVSPFSQSMAWSPDSRWLFVAENEGDLVVIDARHGRTHRIPLSGGAKQVVVRTAR